MSGRVERDVDVLVVGAGPAGLAAATVLGRVGAGVVEVVDRETQPGGVPRHCDHVGFGLRDLRKAWRGPTYAEHRTALAQEAGAEVRTGVTVTGWAGDRTLDLTGPGGLERVRARAVVLATGARERPRSARLVPGDRPAGVWTTGALQQAVHLGGEQVGERAVVVGAEHVSYSAVLTLAKAGVRTVAMVTDQPDTQTFPAFDRAARMRYRFPLLTSTVVGRLVGSRRLEAVEVRDARGHPHVLEADTVVFTGDWVPDHELARRGGLELDPGSRGPVVDGAHRTSAHGVFAAGNLVHPVETADVVALAGEHTGEAVLEWLRSQRWRGPGGSVEVTADRPLRWVAPRLVGPDLPRPPSDRFVLWAEAPAGRVQVEVRQDSRLLHTQRWRRVVPNRALHLPASWASAVDPTGPPVRITLRAV